MIMPFIVDNIIIRVRVTNYDESSRSRENWKDRRNELMNISVILIKKSRKHSILYESTGRM